jgi:hypothetical protein
MVIHSLTVAAAFEHESDPNQASPAGDSSSCEMMSATPIFVLHWLLHSYLMPLAHASQKVPGSRFSTNFSRPLIRTAEISNVGWLAPAEYCFPNDIGQAAPECKIAQEPASTVPARRAS